ncbi:hypothetical protein V8J88_04045 [Massilia sp. W12]|uniref:NHL domain-containing protein n=1 Tax=Massilia sp. W12 TaxID=3126507 RepID=UPI0030CD7D08
MSLSSPSRRLCLTGLGLLSLSSLLSACGGSGGDKSTVAQTPSASQLSRIELLAGDTGGDGNVDGNVADAHYFNPGPMVFDASGKLYLSDSGNHTIRVIGRDGKVSTLAGLAGVAGSSDGLANQARFAHPDGIAVDEAGNVYVADRDNHVLRKISPDGMVSTLAGQTGVAGVADGVGAQASLSRPGALLFGPDRRLYLADSEHGLIRTIDLSGRVGTLALNGPIHSPDNGVPFSRHFGAISGMAFDRAGNLYVSDSEYAVVQRISPSGELSLFAGKPQNNAQALRESIDGQGRNAQFIAPARLALDLQGNVLLSDLYSLRKIAPDATVSTLSQATQQMPFLSVQGIAVRPDGEVLLSIANYSVDRIASNGISGLYSRAGGADFKPLSPARVERILRSNNVQITVDFSRPGFGSSRFCLGSDGALYLTDGQGAVHRLDGNGSISTRTMIGEPARNGITQIPHPGAIAQDGAGNIFLSSGYNLYRIAANGMVTQIAGRRDDASLPAHIARLFESVSGLAALPDGTLFAADALLHCIFKITPGGAVSIFAGAPGSRGDSNGQGQAARFKSPQGLALDAAGNLYVADSENYLVRKISPDGQVSTAAGQAGVAGDTDGVSASLGRVSELALNAQGEIYLLEEGKQWLRKIGRNGSLSTVAGSRGKIGNQPGPLPGSLGKTLQGLAVAGDGTVYLGSDRALLALRA